MRRYDLSAIMTDAHARRRKAVKIAAGKKVMNLATKEWEHPNMPPFGEFLREAWRQVKERNANV
jgi:hypothetical protein